MSKDEFEVMQLNCRRIALSSLLRDCITRYCNAAYLVQNLTDDFYAMSDNWRNSNIDITPLFPFWVMFCEKYRDQFFSQASLLQDEEEMWSKFIHWNFFPQLVRDDHFVRYLLIAVRLIQSEKVDYATDSLLSYIPETFSLEPPNFNSWEK